MNNKEELKSAVIKLCVEGSMTVKEGAKRLGFSERYVKKLKARYKLNGAKSMLHGNCGRKPKKTTDLTIQNRILEIRNSEDFKECNITHFKELLEEYFEILISYTALYNLLSKNGMRSPKRHKKSKAHTRRPRRETPGELVQADATPFQFFHNDDNYYTLHGFIDDATNNITGLYMSKNECMHGYLEVTKQTIKNFGIPLSIYADGSSIFFPRNEKLSIEEQLQGETKPITQYGKMLETLGSSLIHARSSQAKGRIERLWETLQDRLKNEFKINKISTLEDANNFLLKYIKKFNNRFSVKPTNERSSYLELPNYINLDYVLSVKYSRTVDISNAISLNSTTFVVETKELLHKKKIEICISKKLGVRAYFNKKWYKLKPISTQNKSLQSNESIDAIIENFIFNYCLKNERVSA